MESRKDLFVFNVQAFSWASHLEHLDLRNDSWNGTLRIEKCEEENQPTLPIDQARGHLTPGLLGQNQRCNKGSWKGLIRMESS